MENKKELLFDLIYTSYLFFNEGYGINNAKEYYKQFSNLDFENIESLNLILDSGKEEIENAINIVSGMLKTEKQFVIACLKYYLIVRYDYFYITTHFEITNNYLYYKNYNDLWKVWDLKSNGINNKTGNKIKILFSKLYNALNKLSDIQNKSDYEFSNDIKKWHIKNTKIIEHEKANVVFKDIIFSRTNDLIVIESINEFFKMYLNTINYLNSKIFINSKTTMICINRFLHKSTPENFVCLLYFIMDVSENKSIQNKKLKDVYQYVLSLIKNNLIYFGFLESLYMNDFTVILEKRQSQMTLL